MRELRNALERAMILSDGSVLDVALFGSLPQHGASAPPDVTDVTDEADEADETSLEGLERRAIEAALEAVGGNRRAAAERLGIGRRTLYDKLKRYEKP